MILDFNNMETQVIPCFKGGEKDTVVKMFDDGLNRIMLGKLTPGASIGLHTHKGSSEIIYLLSGHGKVLYDGDCERLDPGMAHYCPEGHEHSLINDGKEDLIYFAAVPQHNLSK